ncbi:MAG: hypothetical protein IJA78_03210 [Clostridia bacterium]|nr:hypothetical protein [Clostridia bacterium]
MTIFEKSETALHSLRHGGIEVLRVSVRYPLGESAAETHVRALCRALEHYAEKTLRPRAAAELEEAVRAGRGFSFIHHAYEISFSAVSRGRTLTVCVTAALTAGEAQKKETLCMRWTRDGAFQLRASRTREKLLAKKLNICYYKN